MSEPHPYYDRHKLHANESSMEILSIAIKAIVVILFLLMATNLFSQNTLSLCFQPSDRGYGFRYDRSFSKYGAYTSLTRGSFHWTGGYIQQHWKTALGLSYTLGKARIEEPIFLSAGGTYHIFRGVVYGNEFDKKALRPFDIELGVGMPIKKVVLSVRYEVLHNLSSIDLGVKF